MNKRGAETTIGTIVVVILAIIVLVVVAAGFTMGWNNLFSRFKLFIPKALSIDAVVAKCDSLCLANQKNSYCCEPQEVELKEGESTVKKTENCNDLYNKAEYADNGKHKFPINCQSIDCSNVKC